jgi:hypothetical protein
MLNPDMLLSFFVNLLQHDLCAAFESDHLRLTQEAKHQAFFDGADGTPNPYVIVSCARGGLPRKGESQLKRKGSSIKNGCIFQARYTWRSDEGCFKVEAIQNNMYVF